MNTSYLTTDRLAGLIAGAFFLRAAMALSDVVMPLFSPADDPRVQFFMFARPFIILVAAACLGYGYLVHAGNRWLNIIALAALSLAGCAVLLQGAMPFIAKGRMEWSRDRIVADAIANEAIVFGFISSIVLLMRRLRQAQPV